MASREELGKLTEEQLDEAVHDMKAGEAATINNAGKEAQIKFILAEAPKAGTVWVKVYVRGGVAEVVKSSGVRVELQDYDNDGCKCDLESGVMLPHSHEVFEVWEGGHPIWEGGQR